MCLDIRVIPKIRDLLVVKLTSFSLDTSLKDLATLATCLMLPAERVCKEVVAGAGEAGGRETHCAEQAWGSTKDCQGWEGGSVSGTAL